MIFHSKNFNRTLLFNSLLCPNQILIFLPHTKTFLILLFHTINLMTSKTLLTPTPTCSIILYTIPLPFHKHSLVLLTRLIVYLKLPPILTLHPLEFELPILCIIYAHFLLKTTTLRNLLLVSYLGIMLNMVNWITCQTCHCIPSTQ